MSGGKRVVDFVTYQGERVWIDPAKSFFIAELRVASTRVVLNLKEAKMLRDGLNAWIEAADGNV